MFWHGCNYPWSTDGQTVFYNSPATGQPGAVKVMPQMTDATFALFLAGSLWLGLWHGRKRLLGLVPVALATAPALHHPQVGGGILDRGNQAQPVREVG